MQPGARTRMLQPPPSAPLSPQILLHRKLLLLPSKISMHASNAISLVEASPRFDERHGTIHLSVSDLC